MKSALALAVCLGVVGTASVAWAGKKAAPCTPTASLEVPGKGVRAVVALDAKTAAAAAEDGSVSLVDIKAAKVLKTVKGHKGAIYALALSPDGKTLATGAEDKKVILWDVKTLKPRAEMGGHDNTVRGLAFSADGKTLYSASLDKQIGLWDVDAGKLQKFIGGQACILHGVAASKGSLKDGSPFLGAACNDGLVRIVNLKTGQSAFNLVQRFEDEEEPGSVHAVAFAQTGEGGNYAMASADVDGNVRLWDLRKQSAKFNLQGPSTEVVVFSPDGSLLVAAGNDMAQRGMFRLWDTATGKALNEQQPHQGNIGGAAFTPDGKTFLTGGMDEEVKVWDVEKLKKGCN